MKRTGLITLAACFAVLVMAVVVIRYPRTVPLDECSDVYKRYKDVEGVRATYIKDFRVNDTLTIGVTLLEATDSEGWERLLKAFDASRDMQKRKTEASVWHPKAIRRRRSSMSLSAIVSKCPN